MTLYTTENPTQIVSGSPRLIQGHQEAERQGKQEDVPFSGRYAPLRLPLRPKSSYRALPPLGGSAVPRLWVNPLM